MGDIVVPQNTIDSARPADLSFAGEHQGLTNTAIRALELKRATEALRSQEALTKAYKDATDPKTGAINFALVKEELKNNPDYTLGAGEDTAGIGQNAERQKSTADEFNRSNAELQALYNRGGITQQQLQQGIAFNRQGIEHAGVAGTGQYGSDAYTKTLLETQPNIGTLSLGDQIGVLKTSPIAAVNTPSTITNMFRTGIDPNRIAEIETRVNTLKNQDSGGNTYTTQYQPIVTNRYGQVNQKGKELGTISSYTTEQANAYQKAVDQAPKDIQDETTNLANLTKAAISAYNNQGKPDYTPEAYVLAQMGITADPKTLDRATLHKLVASYNVSNIAPTVEQQKNVADQIGNEKIPDSVLIASSLLAAQHAANLLHAKYLLTHPRDLGLYQKTISKYGPNANELGMAYHLSNLLKSNPKVAKRTIMLLNKGLPSYLNNINDARNELLEMQKQGLFPQGTIQ